MSKLEKSINRMYLLCELAETTNNIYVFKQIVTLSVKVFVLSIVALLRFIFK